MKQTPVHHAHNPDLLRFMPLHARRVIEVGCSSGALAREYRKLNPNVHYTGVEVVPEYAELARAYCDRVIDLDIEAVDDHALRTDLSADCWVFGDVLEHLRDPWQLLKRIRVAMGHMGSVVACVPNMQHWSIQARLSIGDVRYADSGLLDRTHLRWFTRATMNEMFAQAGYRIEDSHARVFDEPQREIFLPVIRSMASATRTDPDAAARDAIPLQYVVRAVSDAAAKIDAIATIDTEVAPALKRIRVLCHFNHFFSASEFVGNSTSGNRQQRLDIVQQALNAVRSLPFDVDVRVCGFTDSSLIPVDLDLTANGDPQHIVSASIERMFDSLDQYDYFLNLQDDILVSGDTLAAAIAFNEVSATNEVYLPNRLKRDDEGTAYCVDLGAIPDWRTLKRDYRGISLCVANNSHPSFLFLSRKQMQYAQDRVSLSRRDQFVDGFVASAYANVHQPFLLWRAQSDTTAHHVVHLDKWNAPAARNAPAVVFQKSVSEAISTPDMPHMDAGGLDAFAEQLRGVNTYLEYGCGESTVLAVTSGVKHVIGVDTSSRWIQAVHEKTASLGANVHLNHCDVGPIDDRGRTLDISSMRDFYLYAVLPWMIAAKAKVSPELVFVNGRFRVACFLYSLASAKAGTVIVFDDYADRPVYRVAEQFCRVEQMSGSTAVFRVAHDFNVTELMAYFAKYSVIED